MLVHRLFETLALGFGTVLYQIGKRKAGKANILIPGEFSVVVGCVFGAAIGNKAVFWIEMPHLFVQYWSTPAVLLSGQSMVGGVLGGLIGVEIAKRINGITRSTGDAFVFPVLFGLMIGRVGCFLAGLEDGTFGVATDLPWGIDFGDGIRRHPTQLYEIVFAGLLAWTLARWRVYLVQCSGLSFKVMLVAYLAWRLAVEAIKPVPYVYPLGLSGIQWVCLSGLIIYLPITIRLWMRLPKAARLETAA